MLAKILINFQIMIFLFYSKKEFNYKILFYKFLKICAFFLKGKEQNSFEDIYKKTLLFVLKNYKMFTFSESFMPFYGNAIKFLQKRVEKVDFQIIKKSIYFFAKKAYTSLYYRCV